MNQQTAHSRIRKHLLQGKKLTALQSLELFNIQRLAPVIHRMRTNEGLNVVTEKYTTPSNKVVARYFIPKN